MQQYQNPAGTHFSIAQVRLYYGFLGAMGWEHVSWKKPHEDGAVRNGNVGGFVIAVMAAATGSGRLSSNENKTASYAPVRI